MTEWGIGLLALGLALYFGNVFLIKWFLDRRAPGMLDLDAKLGKPPPGESYLWERTAGTGLVPGWVSFIGLMSIPAVLAGLVLIVIGFLS